MFKIKKWSDRGEFEELHLDAVYLKYVEIFALYRLDNYYVIDDRNLLNTNNTGFTDLKTSQKVADSKFRNYLVCKV